MIDKQQLSFELRMEKVISEIEKNQGDLRKANPDAKLSDKKIKWYELSLIFIVFGLGVALAKLFL